MVGIEIKFEKGVHISQQNTISDLKRFLESNVKNRNAKKMPVSPLWIRFAFAELKKYPKFGPVNRITIREKLG